MKKVLLCLICVILLFSFAGCKKVEDTPVNNNINEINNDNQNQIEDNNLPNFDLSFLKNENTNANKVYSPLSIKYALNMLEDGANGASKSQISNLLGDYHATKYSSSENLSIANGLFIRDGFRDKINLNYIGSLKEKYDADVKFDSFSSSKNINDWINDKTHGIISNVIRDDEVKDVDLTLINSLSIDMDWKEKFLVNPNYDYREDIHYLHENVDMLKAPRLNDKLVFNGEAEISGMEINAAVNNYDIVNILGEEKIREIVENAFWKQLEDEKQQELYDLTYGDIPKEQWISEFLDKYIEELNSNYHKYGDSTEFSLYVDDEVKAFAKDLKNYDGVTLQYIGIIPTKQELNSYVENVNLNDINKIISNLKNIEPQNFKEGVVTQINGFIPKFKFEYELNLIEDLKKLGIEDVFKYDVADLSNIAPIEEKLYIQNAIHKTEIEFTQDGIKAASVTSLGAYGGGGDWFSFEYSFDVPIEKIDLTFDKPYMFLVRDKDNGEIWFIGTVYEPTLWDNDATRIDQSNEMS